MHQRGHLDLELALDVDGAGHEVEGRLAERHVAGRRGAGEEVGARGVEVALAARGPAAVLLHEGVALALVLAALLLELHLLLVHARLALGEHHLGPLPLHGGALGHELGLLAGGLGVLQGDGHVHLAPVEGVTGVGQVAVPLGDPVGGAHGLGPGVLGVGAGALEGHLQVRELGAHVVELLHELGPLLHEAVAVGVGGLGGGGRAPRAGGDGDEGHGDDALEAAARGRTAGGQGPGAAEEHLDSPGELVGRSEDGGRGDGRRRAAPAGLHEAEELTGVAGAVDGAGGQVVGHELRGQAHLAPQPPGQRVEPQQRQGEGHEQLAAAVALAGVGQLVGEDVGHGLGALPQQGGGQHDGGPPQADAEGTVAAAGHEQPRQRAGGGEAAGQLHDLGARGLGGAQEAP